MLLIFKNLIFNLDFKVKRRRDTLTVLLCKYLAFENAYLVLCLKRFVFLNILNLMLCNLNAGSKWRVRFFITLMNASRVMRFGTQTPNLNATKCSEGIFEISYEG